MTCVSESSTFSKSRFPSLEAPGWRVSPSLACSSPVLPAQKQSLLWNCSNHPGDETIIWGDEPPIHSSSWPLVRSSPWDRLPVLCSGLTPMSQASTFSNGPQQSSVLLRLWLGSQSLGTFAHHHHHPCLARAEFELCKRKSIPL